MPWNRKRKDEIVRTLFMIGVAAKGIDGVLELLGAIVLFLVPAAQIPELAHALLLHEIKEDPQDLLVGIVATAFQQFRDTLQTLLVFIDPAHRTRAGQ